MYICKLHYSINISLQLDTMLFPPPHFFLSEKHNFSICVMLLLAFSPFLTSDCSWWDQPLLGTLVVVTLQLPCEGEGKRERDRGRGGEGEGWEGREEEGMNQNTIKGTGWPFWELKARWLEAARTDGGGKDTEEKGRSKKKERPMRPFILRGKERLHCSLGWQQNKVS